MRKGLALPINTMVALAIAIVVLLAMVAFFMGIIGPAGRQQTEEQKYRNCCSGYVSSGCKDSGTDWTAVDLYPCGKDDEGNDVALGQLGAAIGVFTEDDIKSACGCVGSGGLVRTTTTGGGSGLFVWMEAAGGSCPAGRQEALDDSVCGSVPSSLEGKTIRCCKA